MLSSSLSVRETKVYCISLKSPHDPQGAGSARGRARGTAVHSARLTLRLTTPSSVIISPPAPACCATRKHTIEPWTS